MERPVWDDEPKESGFFNLSVLKTRWFMVTIAALAGIMGVAILYYLFTPSSAVIGEVPVVEASPEPLKVKPEAPGGWVAPHQDKEIYENLLAPRENRGAETATLRPGAEQPLPMPAEADVLEVSDKGLHVAVEEVIEPAQVESLPVITAPAPLESLPGVVVHREPEKRAEKNQEEAPARPVAPVAKGKVKVQLASLPSKGLAEKEVRLLKRKHASLLKGKSLIVTEAKVPQKGTVFRVQLGGFASAAQAGAFCKKMQDKGAHCFLAK